MMGQQRRWFSPEFNHDAIALHKSSGRSIAAVAKELGIGDTVSASDPRAQLL